MLRWLPENVSTFGGEIDSLLALIYAIVGAWFLLLHVLIIFCLIRFRRGKNRKAAYLPGNTRIQYAWILVPAAVVLLLDFYIEFRGAEVWALIKESSPRPDLEIRVTGKQFNWEILYPGPDGRFDTGDDVLLENTMHVPVDRNVHVYLRSRDVIHSFFLPHLRLKQDAIPGREIPVWFQATRPGRYEIACAELCGFGHSGMKGWLIVHDPPEYREWVQETWPPE